jgi:hypothetical protein
VGPPASVLFRCQGPHLYTSQLYIFNACKPLATVSDLVCFPHPLHLYSDPFSRHGPHTGTHKQVEDHWHLLPHPMHTMGAVFSGKSKFLSDMCFINNFNAGAGDLLFTFHVYTTNDQQGIRPKDLCPNRRVVDHFVPKRKEVISLHGMYNKHRGTSDRCFNLDLAEVCQLISCFGLCESSLLYSTILILCVPHRILYILIYNLCTQSECCFRIHL